MKANKINVVGILALLAIGAILLIQHYNLTDEVQRQTVFEKLQVAPVPAHTNMPPGFKLLVSVDGRYKSAFDSGVYVGEGTKKEAVDAAWSQYEFGKRDTEAKWREVK